MREPIQDEFTNLPVSRQRKWSLRKQAEGRCLVCGAKVATALYCLKHAVYNRERLRKSEDRIRRNDSLTYRLEATAI